MSTRARTAVAGLVALAALAGNGLLAGCGNPADVVTGGDPIADYCHQLDRDRPAFAAMIGEGSPTALVTHLPMLRELAGQAPDDIADDWQVFVGAIAGLEHALRDAGVKPSAYAGGRAPAGLEPGQRKAIQAAADRISAPQTVAAAATIEQEARDVCKINLGM